MMKYSIRAYLKKDKTAARLRVLLEQVICALSTNLEARQISPYRRQIPKPASHRHATPPGDGEKGEGEMGREPGESDFRGGSSVF